MVDKRQHRKTAILSLKKSCPELPHLLLALLYWPCCPAFCVSKLRDTIINISKNAGKLGLKDEGAIQKVDKSVKEVYFRVVAY
ncbi:uncharacterized protein DS421_2g58520 [Arachis hypogaea]|nr:uncharacterized protein DS421_2g58520 [Arachis hypogaea]